MRHAQELKIDILAAQGLLHDALTITEDILRTGAQDARIWRTRADILGRLGEYFEALEAVDHVLELLPEDPDSWGNRGALLQYLERLAPVASDTDLERSARVLLQQRPRRGLIVLVSDLFDPRGLERGLDALRHHGDEVQVIHLTDRAEAQPTLLGDLDLQDAETAALRTVTVTERHLVRYRHLFQVFLQDCERTCRRREIGYLHSTSDVPFDELVLKVLRAGRVVA